MSRPSPAWNGPVANSASSTEPPAARRAVFNDVREIARAEQQRMLGLHAEPPAIQLLRMQAAADAQRTIEEALQHAQRIQAEAQHRGFAEGHAEGRAAGLAEAREEARLQREEFRESAQTLLTLIAAERERMWRQAEDQMLQLVLAVAAKIVKDEALVNPQVALSVLRNALRRLAGQQRITLRVHPNQVEAVRAAREELESLLDGGARLEILEDRRVGAGGCLAEADIGTVDARLETQLNEIEALFRTECAAAREEAA